MNTSHTRLIKITCCALFAGRGFRPKSAGHSDISTVHGGRDTPVTADRDAFVHPQENAFSATLTGHDIVIDHTLVLLDRNEAETAPAGAMKFEVNFSSGTLTAGADGA